MRRLKGECDLLEIVKREACNHGISLAAISVDRLMDVKEAFDKLNIDTSPYYSFEQRTDLGFTARSVLVVASPSPSAYISFSTNNGKMRTVIPPSYIDYEKGEALVKSYLTAILHENGFNIASASRLPCKAIASHAGLGVYGRNNVIYVDGMGSFLRLDLFFSDIPCDYECFHTFHWMECCYNCSLCIESCPTAALTYESSVVNADRCLTWLNENRGDFPGWLNPEWHNALIGCVKCQFACPQNKKFLNSGKEIACFNQEQTKALIDGKVEDMLKPLGLGNFCNVLPRNLKALLCQSS